MHSLCALLCIHALSTYLCSRELASIGCHGYLAILWLPSLATMKLVLISQHPLYMFCFVFRAYATPKSMFKQPHFYSFTLVSPFSSNFTSIHLPHASTLSSFCLPVLPLPPPTGLLFSLPLFSLCSSWFHYRLSPPF